MDIADYQSSENPEFVQSVINVLLLTEPDFNLQGMVNALIKAGLKPECHTDIQPLFEIPPAPYAIIISAGLLARLSEDAHKQLQSLAKKANVHLFFVSSADDNREFQDIAEIHGAEYVYGQNFGASVVQRVRRLRDDSMRISQLAETNEHLQRSHLIANLGYWTLYVQSKQLRLSDSAIKLLHPLLSKPEQSLAKFLAIVHCQDKEPLNAAIQKCIATGRKFSIDHKILYPNGETRFFHTTGQRYIRTGSSDILVLATIQDITDRKLVEITNEHLALYDSLTDLPNRRLFSRKLKIAIKNAQNNEKLLAVCFIDLDKFKPINDNLGHAIGDELLKSVARRLRTDLRHEDIIARLSGDEFAVAIEDISTVDEIEAIIEKIRSSLSRPHSIRQHQLTVTASIGVTIFPMDSGQQHELVNNADAAMYNAKQLGGDCYCYYTYAMYDKAQRRHELMQELKDALQHNQIYVFYQPQYDARTERIVGVEALLRWMHPQQGLMLPFKFLDIAEESEQILPLGRWLIRSACKQLRQWIKMGYADLQLTFNLSAAQLAQSDLSDFFLQVLKYYKIPPANIIVELTEKTLMQDLPLSCEVAEKLKNIGIKLHIDDFGVGESSMEYLQRFPLDGLNIDRSFVMNIADRARDGATAKAIIAMAHSMGLRVKAEGVETRVQLEFLRKHGCDEMQGFVFSPAVTADRLTAQLLTRDPVSIPAAEIT